MRLDRQLARILAAVIVMIAAYLAPSAVQAHPGHTEPMSATVAVQDAGSARWDLPAAIAMTADAETAEVAMNAANPNIPAPIKRCNGLCCCSSGMACCAHALAPESGSLSELTAARLTAAPDVLARPGVDPEALPKPPRSFA